MEKQYTKNYISTKKENEELFFELNFKINTYYDSNNIIKLEIRVTVKYLYLLKNDRFIDISSCDNKKEDIWLLDAHRAFKSASLCSSVMIAPSYRSYGIGSFMLNEIMKIANSYVPDYSLKGTLSSVDEGLDNKDRRNNLYKNIGFNMHDHYFNIEHISNLNLTREYNYIETLNISHILNELNAKNCKIKKLESELNHLKSSYKKIEKSFNSLKKIIKYSLIIFVLFFNFIYLK
ncbi:hypothetical protein [Aliarcobacter butzleri]|uniref:hypothetical protein n=1 Tax=Aliarcobacter butzleri TaxID=28197 RepID=UPI0021B26934|nr:hypothetical protein [Aliarcobacter butzleri]MCT7563203.1 hypothetical protein [Aliarcobacter butzleri]MCT7578678.1 hypothetical protein [Aliarcobacter butzleri]MCT7647619.1 hypothetical protein [Aliarcobacter butzleri]